MSKYTIKPAGNRGVYVCRDGEILSKFPDRREARKAIAQLEETGTINPVPGD